MAGDANSRKITTWFIIGFLVVVTAGVIIAGAFSSGSSSSSSSGANTDFVATTVPPISSTDWVEGNPNAKISLIEYGDFQCPACGEYFPVMQQLLQNYSSTVEFVFRNFPLYTIHPDAGIAAQAAEAAGMEGGVTAYWKMHDLLYTDQATWSQALPADVVAQYFDVYAASLGLATSTFDQDINSNQVLNKIQDDVNSGNTAQVDHTPTFFINLTQIPNPNGLSDFETAINHALASSSATSTSSTQ